MFINTKFWLNVWPKFWKCEFYYQTDGSTTYFRITDLKFTWVYVVSMTNIMILYNSLKYCKVFAGMLKVLSLRRSCDGNVNVSMEYMPLLTISHKHVTIPHFTWYFYNVYYDFCSKISISLGLNWTNISLIIPMRIRRRFSSIISVFNSCTRKRGFMFYSYEYFIKCTLYSNINFTVFSRKIIGNIKQKPSGFIKYSIFIRVWTKTRTNRLSIKAQTYVSFTLNLCI